MPSSNSALDLLVRQQPLTEKEWIELLERRRRLIKPHLNSFTLTELGRFPCLLRYIQWVGIREAQHPNCGLTAYGTGGKSLEDALKTQGIFGFDTDSDILTPDRTPMYNCRRFLWGLSRSGKWMLIEIWFLRGGSPDLPTDGVYAFKIQTVPVEDLLTIQHLQLRDVWLGLGEAVAQWMKKRQELLDDAEELADQVNLEESLINLLPNYGQLLPATS